MALVLLSGIALFGGLLAFVITQFVDGAPALVGQVTTSIEGVGTWLTEGPLQKGEWRPKSGMVFTSRIPRLIY